jgi:hypothetical protein
MLIVLCIVYNAKYYKQDFYSVLKCEGLLGYSLEEAWRYSSIVVCVSVWY